GVHHNVESRHNIESPASNEHTDHDDEQYANIGQIRCTSGADRQDRHEGEPQLVYADIDIEFLDKFMVKRPTQREHVTTMYTTIDFERTLQQTQRESGDMIA
ncbi:hypothetical protein DPMN_086572, partial [Dreissena polymorpha]